MGRKEYARRGSPSTELTAGKRNKIAKGKREWVLTGKKEREKGKEGKSKPRKAALYSHSPREKEKETSINLKGWGQR